MTTIFPPDKIYLSQSKIPKAGRGVFAKIDIKKDEIIEQCPVIEIAEYEADKINETSLVEYIYYFDKSKERLTIVLGFGSIYNHSSEPNAKYKENHKEKRVDFIAIRDMEKDEEITVDYRGDKNKNLPLWFEV